MEYRRLGRSGLQVSALSLGSWLTFGKQIGDNLAEDLMRVAYENGINFFDNAEIYSRGESEIVMGKLLRKLAWERDTYIVSSKVFFGAGGKLPTQVGLHRKHVMEACHAALKRLQVEYLDLYFCHRPDKNTPIEETVWTMDTLIRQGKIFYWGTSEWSAAEIMEAHRVASAHHLIAPVMEQPQYNMFHREKMEKEFLPVFSNHGMGTTIWSPLASGLLTGKHNKGIAKDSRLGMEGLEWLREREVNEERIKKVNELVPIAKELGISLSVMAVAWCLKNPNVSTIILGASKTEQLEENFKALEAVSLLTDDVMRRIDQVLGNKPEQPAY